MSIGSAREWISTTNSIMAKRPRVALAVHMATISPLLPIMGAGGFFVLLSGPAATGKSTLLKLAQSVWGASACPVNPWPTSDLKADGIALVGAGIPILMDDFLDPEPKAIQDTGAYLLRETRQQSCILGACKNPVPSSTRLMSIWGLPFGAESAESAEAVLDIQAMVGETSGHLGPMIVDYLTKHQERHAAVRGEYLSSLRRTAVPFGATGGLTSALASHVAAITTAARVTQGICPGLKSVTADHIAADLLDWVKTAYQTESPAVLAAYMVRQFIAKQSHRIVGIRTRAGVPQDGWVGTNEGGKTYLLYEVVRRLVASQGYGFDQILREWHDSGMLLTNGSGNSYVSLLIGGEPVNCIGFR